MLSMRAEPPGREVLLEMAFQPAEEFIHKGISDQPTIRTLKGRANRILIGTPQVTNILDHWPNDDVLDSEIQALGKNHDFISVRLACSFVPDRGCSFTWGRLAIELSLVPNSPSPEGSIIAFDLFPREIIDKQKYKRSFSITPKVKFAFGEASVSTGTEQEGILYHPQMSGAGLLTNTPTWTFSADSKPGVLGTKELFLLLKKPKHSTAQARFVVGAEVLTSFGRIPLKRYGNDTILDKTYSLGI